MGMLEKASSVDESADKKKKSKEKASKEHLKPDPYHGHPKGKESDKLPSNKPGAKVAEASADASAPEPTDDDTEAQGQGDDEASDGAQPSDAQDDSQGDGGDADSSPQPPDQSDASDSDDSQDSGDAGSGDQGGAPPDGGDQDDSAPPTGQDPSQGGGAPAPSGQGAVGGNQIDLSQVPVSPALKEEYMRCNAALYTALYTNDKVATAVMNGIVPSGAHKIDSVVRMCMLVFAQLNKKLNFVKETPQIVLPFARDIVEHVLDLAVSVKKIQFSDQESQAAVGSVIEAVQRAVGVTQGNMKALKHVIPRSQLQDAANKYKAHLAYTKGAVDLSQGGPPGAGGPPGQPPAGGAPPGGAPPQGASPAGGPPPGQPDGGQPQPGAPVTAAPGPGQSAPPGGMLTQAASQPPGQ